MVEVARTSADDPARRGIGRAQSWIFCPGGRWLVAMATKRLGAAPCPGGSNDGFCRPALRAAADPRQFGATLYAGVFSLADRVGEFCISLRRLVLVARCLAVCVDLIRFLINLLVVFYVGVNCGSIVLGGR